MSAPSLPARPAGFAPLSCAECAAGAGLDFEFSMAFQPIYHFGERAVIAWEALVRGPQGQGADYVFARVNDGNRYRFDQACRVKAVQLAARLQLPGLLSINFMPNAVYRPEVCIRTTIAAAEQFGFPVERILLEFTEDERVDDHRHVRSIVEHYRARGFRTAIDDFGAGYAGLNLLANVPTDIVKLDMALVRGVDRDPVRQRIVRSVIELCADLKRLMLAEGVETAEELATLRGLGVEVFQGYLLARPAFERLPFPDPALFPVA